MANINLNNYFRKSTDIKSPVDSRIQLNKAETEKDYWGDLRLDLKFNEIKERPLNAKQSTKDLQRTVNEQSVIVALKNIFNTHECSRLLNPQMKFELGTYLFQPLSHTKAWFLGYDIYQILSKYDPRIRIQSVQITPNFEKNCYIISLVVLVPSITDQQIKISSVLSSQGYSIL